jgi:hypothetical protein
MGPKIPLGEELLDEAEQGVFAEGEPLAVAVDLLGAGPGARARRARAVAGLVTVTVTSKPHRGQQEPTESWRREIRLARGRRHG